MKNEKAASDSQTRQGFLWHSNHIDGLESCYTKQLKRVGPSAVISHLTSGQCGDCTIQKHNQICIWLPHQPPMTNSENNTFLHIKFRNQLWELPQWVGLEYQSDYKTPMLFWSQILHSKEEMQNQHTKSISRALSTRWYIWASSTTLQSTVACRKKKNKFVLKMSRNITSWTIERWKRRQFECHIQRCI